MYSRIRLQFEVFDLEEAGNCRRADYLRVSWVSPITDEGTYCGKELPGPFTSEGNKMNLWFESDILENGQGFLATWTEVPPNNLIEGQTQGEFKTPNYPRNYPRNTKIVQTFAFPDGAKVEFKVVDFQTERSYDFFCINRLTPQSQVNIVFEWNPDTFKVSSFAEFLGFLEFSKWINFILSVFLRASLVHPNLWERLKVAILHHLLSLGRQCSATRLQHTMETSLTNKIKFDHILNVLINYRESLCSPSPQESKNEYYWCTCTPLDSDIYMYTSQDSPYQPIFCPIYHVTLSVWTCPAENGVLQLILLSKFSNLSIVDAKKYIR